MAFYFERAFESSKQVDVLNGLRIQLKDHDAVQIDHLLVHRHGMVIVETKSIYSEVKINRYGEWSRWFDGQWKGMESPIQQAKRQAEALRAVLVQNKTRLRDRKLFGLLQGGSNAVRSSVWLVSRTKPTSSGKPGNSTSAS